MVPDRTMRRFRPVVRGWWIVLVALAVAAPTMADRSPTSEDLLRRSKEGTTILEDNLATDSGTPRSSTLDRASG